LQTLEIMPDSDNDRVRLGMGESFFSGGTYTSNLARATWTKGDSMAISVECQGCGAKYHLKQEFAGKNVKCPKCSMVIGVPGEEEQDHLIEENEPDGLHEAFRRDKFLLRQKHMSINQKYHVWDDQGATILFIERPSHVLKTLAALFAFFFVLIAAIGGGVGVVAGLGRDWPDAVQAILMTIALFGGVILALLVLFALIPKRHIHFYSDENRSEKLLDIIQENKIMILSAYYSVLLPDGTPLGRFKKNYLYNIFRKRWYAFDATLQPSLIAMEDSLILSLLRRFLGPMFGLLRTNYVIREYGSDGKPGTILGEFNRKFTLLDRYVLDLSADRNRTLDRRMALALGVLLDTGETR